MAHLSKGRVAKLKAYLASRRSGRALEKRMGRVAP